VWERERARGNERVSEKGVAIKRRGERARDQERGRARAKDQERERKKWVVEVVWGGYD